MAIIPKSELIVFRVTPELKKRIGECAAVECKTEADFLRDVLTRRVRYLAPRYHKKAPHKITKPRVYGLPKPPKPIEPDFIKPLNIRWPDINFNGDKL